MLVSSTLSFSENAFKRLLSQGHENQELFGKGLKVKIAQDKNSTGQKLMFLK